MSHCARMRFLKAMIALGLFLGATISVKAQDTLPPNTALGRTGITPGPAQAIPFTILGPLLTNTGLTVGVSTIAGGLANGLLFNSSGVLQNNGPIVSTCSNPTGNGQWSICATNTLGAIVIGQGSIDDACVGNKNGVCALSVPTGTTHLAVGTSAPTNNACAGFALGTGSTDLAGRVTFTSATSCAINFGTAFTNAPFCVVSPGSAASTHFVATTTAVLTVTFGTAQTAMFYHCFGA